MIAHAKRTGLARGFSLIEVLLAVVVLAFGLLALASLQTSLIRASSESKSQSTALQLAKDKLEDLRSYQSLAGYQALTSGNDTVNDNGGSLGGVNFARTWTVERFAFDKADGVFEKVATLTGPTPAGYEADNEYKKITVSVSWADATGATQTIGMEDAISALNPGDSTKLVRSNAGATPRKPIVLIDDPSGSAGVIPIAIGDDSSTAATNPKPIVAGKNNSQRVVETRFDVLTYSALSGGVARVQSRVETSVVGCRCDYGTAPDDTEARGLRPTYWNGFRYAPPQETGYVPPAGEAALSNGSPPQSARCDVCCRDHHDPNGVSGAKFDPRRSTHSHYRIVDGSLVAAGSGEYVEACRLIRVDGFFRVAADMYNDHFGLLETRSDGTSLAYAPKVLAADGYAEFVLDYLEQRVYGVAAAPENFNTPLSDAIVVQLEDDADIDEPDNIDFDAKTGLQWLHSRGLYIDYLEPEARDRIVEEKGKCTSGDYDECVLPYMPFTSINLTEISLWSPLSGTQIVVTNNDFASSVSSDEPVRGKVSPGSKPVSNTKVDAVASIYHSNSGVALLPDPIDPQDEKVQNGGAVDMLQDTQQFTIKSTAGGSGGSYAVTFDGYTFSASSAGYPAITASPGATCNFATSGTPRPNPYTCTTQTTGVATTLTVGNYNYEYASGNRTIKCTKPDGTDERTYTTGNNEKVWVCRNYRVDSAESSSMLAGIVGSPSPADGRMAESTTISFSNIDNGDAIKVLMVLQGETLAPYTCTYTGTAGTNLKGVTIAAEHCQ